MSSYFVFNHEEWKKRWVVSSTFISSFNHPKILWLILIQDVQAPYFQQKNIVGQKVDDNLI